MRRTKLSVGLSVFLLQDSHIVKPNHDNHIPEFFLHVEEDQKGAPAPHGQLTRLSIAVSSVEIREI